MAAEASTRARLHQLCAGDPEDTPGGVTSRRLLDQDGDAEVDGATLELFTPFSLLIHRFYSECW